LRTKDGETFSFCALIGSRFYPPRR